MAGGLRLPSLDELTDRIHSLPGVGARTAERIAYHILEMDDKDVDKLVSSIEKAHNGIHRCSICGNYTERDICGICSDETRDKSIICVVEKPKDIISFEKSKALHCNYHVLHGLLRPSVRINTSDMRINELILRIKKDGVKEVIMATDMSVPGEATAMYIAKLIKPVGVKVTRLGFGLSVGADLQYTDEVTLARSLKSRSEL